MKVLVSGPTGMLGPALLPRLTAVGHPAGRAAGRRGRLRGRDRTGRELVVEAAGFAGQRGIGENSDLWPETPSGGLAPAAYRAAFGTALALQILGLGWFALSRRSPPGPAKDDRDRS